MAVIYDFGDDKKFTEDMNEFYDELLLLALKAFEKLQGNHVYSCSSYIKALEYSGDFTEFSRKYNVNRKKIIARIIIEYSTTIGSQREKRKVRNCLLNHPYVKDCNGDAPFIRLSSLFGNFRFRPIINRMNDETIINKDALSPKERFAIYSGNNIGNCFETSLNMGYLYNGLNVVTGFMNTEMKNYKMAHSWIETKIDGKNIVLDFCFNLYMPREDYYDLFDVEVCSIISHEELQEELPLMEKTHLQNRDYLLEREKTLEIARRVK